MFTYKFYQFLVEIDINILSAGVEENKFRKFLVLRADSSPQLDSVLHHSGQRFAQELLVYLIEKNLGVLVLLQAGHLHSQHLGRDHQELGLQLSQVSSLQDNGQNISNFSISISILTGIVSTSPWSMKKQLQTSWSMDKTCAKYQNSMVEKKTENNSHLNSVPI